MKKLKFIVLLFISIFFISCNPSQNIMHQEEELNSCPQCNMKLPKSNLHTSTVDVSHKRKYFDDIGCMILWANENNIDLTKVKTKVFSNDTNRYIDAVGANYNIGDKTPMGYGFAAYENKQKDSIDFKQVILSMLRGESMANPKIRKQVLKN